MTVRDKVGRNRYVAFRVEGGGVPRNAIVLPEGAKLTRFDGEYGIAKCAHTKSDALIAALTSVTKLAGKPASVRTIVTSGTLKAAAARLPASSPASKRGPRPSRQG